VQTLLAVGAAAVVRILVRCAGLRVIWRRRGLRAAGRDIVAARCRPGNPGPCALQGVDSACLFPPPPRICRPCRFTFIDDRPPGWRGDTWSSCRAFFPSATRRFASPASRRVELHLLEQSGLAGPIALAVNYFPS